jgi:transposase
MANAPTPECPNCRRLQAYVAKLEGLVAELQDRIARLEKNSSNSHKPPSSDIVKPKPPRPRRGNKRRIGGQPGHPRYERAPFAPDQIDRTELYSPGRQCPDCGGDLQLASEPPRIVQQVDLVQKPVVVTEHRAPAYWCQHCQKVQRAQLPYELRRAGLVGTRLTALVGWLKGSAHASYSTIQALLEDVLGVRLSRGQLVRLVRKAGRALDPAYAELRQALPNERCLNVDETGHKECGRKLWTWCFRARGYTLFKIDESRGSKVLLDALGEEFDGVLGCDYFSAYRKYMKDISAQVQFCLAHLIRDVKFLTTLDGHTRKYGKRLMGRLRALFRVFHRREKMRPDRFQRALERERKAIVHAACHPPWTREAYNIAERFRRHGDAYFRFITTPGVEPTNNLAEQALRFVVIQRRMTQGTRGTAGRAWCERIWTAVATCRQQGRSTFEFLHSALHAHFTAQPTPSLLSP